MKKRWIVLSSIAAAALLSVLGPQPASARKEYKEAFNTMYGGNDSALVKAGVSINCSVCHVGEQRKNRNAYGQALAKMLTKADTKNTDKINTALKTVEAMKSDPKNASSPTFGDNIKAGKLPTGG